MNLDIDSPDFPKAVCATLEDKDFFFPKIGKQEAERLPQLRALCASCIHERECLSFALDKQIVYGFWGGKSAAERRLATAGDKPVATKGLAFKIKTLRESGQSVWEIAASLATSPYYIRRVFKRLDDANNKGAVQLQEPIKDSSKGSYS